jgi:hypothetical protein
VPPFCGEFQILLIWCLQGHLTPLDTICGAFLSASLRF